MSGTAWSAMIAAGMSSRYMAIFSGVNAGQQGGNISQFGLASLEVVGVGGDDMDQVALDQFVGTAARLAAEIAAKTAGVDLAQGAGLDQFAQYARAALDFGVALGMGNDGDEALGQDLENEILAVGVDVVTGKFEQKIGAVVDGQQVAVVF